MFETKLTLWTHKIRTLANYLEKMIFQFWFDTPYLSPYKLLMFCSTFVWEIDVTEVRIKFNLKLPAFLFQYQFTVPPMLGLVRKRSSGTKVLNELSFLENIWSIIFGRLVITLPSTTPDLFLHNFKTIRKILKFNEFVSRTPAEGHFYFFKRPAFRLNYKVIRENSS